MSHIGQRLTLIGVRFAEISKVITLASPLGVGSGYVRKFITVSKALFLNR